MTPARSAIFSVLGAVFALANLAAATVGAGAGADAAQPANSKLHPSYFERGTAGLIADRLQSTRASSGEIFDHAQLVAAHASLEFGSMVRVTNSATRESVDVRVVERSASNAKSVIELSREAAREIGFTDSGSAKVTLTSTMVRRPAMAHRRLKPLRPAPDQPLIRLMPVSAEIALRQTLPTPSAPTPTPVQSPAPAPAPAPAKQKPEVVAEVPPPAPPPAPKPKADPKPVGAPTPKPEPEAAPAAADGGYRVQFGAFASQSNALQLIQDLQSKGIEARIVINPGQVLNRVVSERAFPDPKNAGEWAGVLLASHGVAETVVTR